jgi:predicted metal-binding membrane protein
MRFMYKKSVIWMLIACFAWLQLLSPLLHAHNSAENKQAAVGMHFHVDFLSNAADKVPTLKNMNAHGDVVSVETSVIRDQALLSLVAVFAVLFVLPVLVMPRMKLPSVTPLLIPLNLRHTSLTPRAPPYF